MINEVINDLGLALAYLVPVAIIWIIGIKAYDKLTPFNLQNHLTEKDNPAVSVALGGFSLGLVLAIGGVFHGYETDMSLQDDLMQTVKYGLLAIPLILISSWINDKVILSHIDTRKEIEKGNLAAGLAEGSSFVANGLILYGALSGDGSLVTGLVFWIISQVVLLVVSIVYNMITKFDSKASISEGNVAVGLSYSGFLIAIGMILKASTQGDFVSWVENMTTFGVVVGFSLITLPLVRLFLDKMVLRKADLCKELSVDKNKGVGALEAIFYISSALMIAWIMLN